MTRKRGKKYRQLVYLLLVIILPAFLTLPLVDLTSEQTVQARDHQVAFQQTVIDSPYKNQPHNYKGNLHAHTTNSDGSDSSTAVGEWYRNNGYDFYGITDHNFLTPDPAVPGILWIGSSEEDSLDGNTAHSNKINITSPIVAGTAQERIDNATSQGGVSVLNHIDRADKLWSAATILGLNNVLAVEIFNGGSDLISTGTWDTVLTGGKTVWGSANDDSHNVGTKGDGYIVVNSDLVSPTEAEILAEMGDGNFYASRGFDVSMSVSGNTINASTTNGNKIRWIKKNGAVIKTMSSKNDSYTIDGSEQYVRVEVLDASNVVKAWSQPLTISGYDYWINSAVNPPSGMSAAGTASVQVHLRNTGSSTWYNEAQYAADPVNRRPMRLAVINADGKTFWPNNDTWAGNDRIAMTSASVAPGQIGSFNFTMKAPTTPGYHTLRFMPVVEGVQALRDIGMQFGTTISYDYWINSAVNPPTTMTAGSTAFVQVHLRNTGASTWYNEGLYDASPSTRRPMRLAVINADGQNFFPNNDTWVDSSRIAMTSSRVAPGEIGSFNFTVKAPVTAGYHTLRFMPVVEGVQALRDIGMQFRTTAR